MRRLINGSSAPHRPSCLLLLLPALLLCAGTLAAAEDPAPLSVPRVIRIDSIDGTVGIRRGSQVVPAQVGALVHESESVQVDAHSKARLSIGDQTVMDVGPSSRLKAQQLGHEDGTGMANLRLDHGYLRLVWADPEGRADRPAAVSFGRWAARVSSGEFFFEAQKSRARACGLAGELVFAGTGADTPKRLSGACADLPAGKRSQTVTPSPAEWQAMREQFTMRPRIDRASYREEHEPGGLSGAPSPPPGADRPAYLEVEAVTGSASTIRDDATQPLAIGQRLEQGQRIDVAGGSGLRVSLKDDDTPFDLGPTFELGPSTRATVRKLPVAESGSVMWLRLDEGAMMVLRDPGDSPSIPLEVSFSNWAARLKTGEFFLESHPESSTVCRLSGDMSLAGVPSTLPQGTTQTCTELRANEAPLDVPLPQVAALREITGVVRVLRTQLPRPYIVGPRGSVDGVPVAATQQGSEGRGSPRGVESALRPIDLR